MTIIASRSAAGHLERVETGVLQIGAEVAAEIGNTGMPVSGESEMAMPWPSPETAGCRRGGHWP